MRFIQNLDRTLSGAIQPRWVNELASKAREAVLLGRHGGEASHRQLLGKKSS
jgi:hypothetical protein